MTISSFKKLFILSAILLSGCVIEKKKEKEVFYSVYCFHPLKKVVKYKVSKRVWERVYHSSDFLWKFQTKTGKRVKASYCYTDNGE